MRVHASAGLIVPAGRRHCSAARRRTSVWVIDKPAGKAYERISAISLQGHPLPWLSITRSLAHTPTAAQVGYASALLFSLRRERGVDVRTLR